MADTALPAWQYPRWVAHRGAGTQAPENTLAAFRLGAAHGFSAFECDVKLSADGVPFLLHDATLERTSNGRGSAGALPWAALSQLDAGRWHSAACAGEPLPTLRAVAAWCIANRHALNIEIKPSPGTEAQTGRVVAAQAAGQWPADAQPPLLSSFSPQALESAQREAPQLPRALLLSALPAGWLDEALSLGCVAVVAQHRLLDEAAVRQVHRAGLHALAYTVNDRAEAERLRGLGVAALITDAIGLFRRAAGGRR